MKLLPLAAFRKGIESVRNNAPDAIVIEEKKKLKASFNS